MKFGTLEVTGSDGRRREFPLDLPSLIVGRAEGNGIVIDDLSISRRHARMLIESGRLLIEDLGSAQGTFVDGHIIEPNVPNLVEPSQTIRFGDVEVRYMAPVAGAATEAGSLESLLPGGGAKDEEPEDEGPLSVIRLNLTDPPAPIQPGTAAFARLVIHNRGRVVDQVTVTVVDLPPDWVAISEQTFKLLPGARQEISIVIQPPQSPDALVGEFDYSVVVTSVDFQREAVVFGQITVLPFEGTQLSVQPLRSKRDFTLVAQNDGNTVANYALSGADDEAELQYEFELPTLDLYPGQQRNLRFRVRQPKRKLFGAASILPYKVVARATHIEAEPVVADGLLAVHPPLQPWKKPALLAALLLVAVGAALFWKFGLNDDGGTKIANAEAAYAGVHMCDKKDAAVAAKPVRPTGGGSAAPLFAQTNPTWADTEYAKAKDPEFGPDWCGTTIEQCGCALTSVATVMALFNLLAMPDGAELTPASVNAWFNTQATKTNHGWVSRGYAYGDVVWTSVNELSGEIARAKPGSPTIRFVRTGTGTEGEIRSELQAGRPIILEVPGHWIAAVGLDGDKILINDPYYADRRTLDVYKGKVKSSVLFEQSNDLSAFVITVPKSERLKVTDKSGKVVGTLKTGSEQEVKESVQLGIEGAFYSTKDAWRDPTCVESPPRPGDGTIQIFLPGNKDDYKIEVLSPDGGPTTVAFHRYDKSGKYSFESKDNTGPAVIAASFDPANIAAGGTTTLPGVTPTADNGFPGGGGVGAGGAGATPPAGGSPATTTTPGAGGSPAASPTATKIAPTATPAAPSSVAVACQVAYSATPRNAAVSCTGTINGTSTTTTWAVNGVLAATPPGATTFATGFSNDTAAPVSVRLTACNSIACTSGVQAVTVKFPAPGATGTPSPTPTVNPSATPTPPPGNPPAVVPITCTYATGTNPVRVDCVTSFSEPYTEITWTATNGSPATLTNASKSFTTFRQSSGSVKVTAKVCYYGNCTTSSEAVVTPPDPPPLLTTTTTVSATYNCTGNPYYISFTATVSPSSATGSVTFSAQGGGGGSGGLDGGVATASSDQFKANGTYNVTGTYPGDSAHAGSSNTATLFVDCGG